MPKRSTEVDCIVVDILTSIGNQNSETYQPDDEMDMDFDFVYKTSKRVKRSGISYHRAPTNHKTRRAVFDKLEELGLDIQQSKGCWARTCGFHMAGCFSFIWWTITTRKMKP